MKKYKKTIHMALQGGGAHGAFTWGILDKILEDGRIIIDGICATSAGSMNAVVLAQGRIDGGNDGARSALHNFWYDISRSTYVFKSNMPAILDKMIRRYYYNCFDTISHIVSPYQFNPYNHNILKNILMKHIDFDQLKKCSSSNLFLSATNVKTGKAKIFNNSELSIDVALASACLPNLFQSVKVGEEYYWDGGYMGNPAIWPLFYHGKTKDVIIVHINPIIRNNIPKDPLEIMNRINEITFNSSLLAELRSIAFVTKLLEEGWIKPEFKNKLHHIFVHSIRADVALRDFDVLSKFDTDWNFLKRLRDLGRIEAELWLENSFDKLGICSSIDIKEDLL